MTSFIPSTATSFGFVINGASAHASRTIMLAELKLLLSACSQEASLAAYRSAIIDDNVLLKPTSTTRLESFKRLRTLYSLRQDVLLFGALRDLWESDVEAQPLLAMLCALARDPVLRATADAVLALELGASVSASAFAEVVQHTFPQRFNATTLATIGRNVASSWQQSGHIVGHREKRRSSATSRPAAVAYAMLLGNLCGAYGMSLFTTLWARVLDAPPNILDSQAFAASQRGWIDYRRIGDIADIGFTRLMRDQEKER